MSTLSGTLGLDDDTEMQLLDEAGLGPVIGIADWSLSLVIKSPIKARRLAELLKTAADLKDNQDKNQQRYLDTHPANPSDHSAETHPDVQSGKRF